MKFEIFNEYEVISFVKVLIFNEIEFSLKPFFVPIQGVVEDDVVSKATVTHFLVEIIPKV